MTNPKNLPDLIIIEGGPNQIAEDRAAKAPALYVSPFVQERIRFGMARAKMIAKGQSKNKTKCLIFSPKYGLLEMKEKYTPYEMALSSMTDEQLTALANRVAWAMGSFKHLKITEVHGSPACVKVIERALAQHEGHLRVSCPMKELTLPEQLKVYQSKAALEDYSFEVDEAVDLEKTPNIWPVKKTKKPASRRFYNGPAYELLDDVEKMVIHGIVTGEYDVSGFATGDKAVANLLDIAASGSNLERIAIARQYLAYPLGWRKLDADLLEGHQRGLLAMAEAAKVQVKEAKEVDSTTEEPVEAPAPDVKEAPPIKTHKPWSSLSPIERGIVHGWKTGFYDNEDGLYDVTDSEQNEAGDRAVALYLSDNDPSGAHKHISPRGIMITRGMMVKKGDLTNIPQDWMDASNPASVERIPFDQLSLLQQAVVYASKRSIYIHDLNNGDRELAYFLTAHKKAATTSAIAQARCVVMNDDMTLKDTYWIRECTWEVGNFPWSTEPKKAPAKKKKPPTPESVRTVDMPAGQLGLTGVVPAVPVDTAPKQSDIVIGDDGSVFMDDEKEADFAALEKRVHDGLETFLDVSEALVEIRDKGYYKLYKCTFVEYVDQNFNLSKSRAYQLIAFGETVKQFNAEGIKPPPNESVARVVNKLPEEERAEALETVREETGREATTKTMQAEVDKRLAKDEPEAPIDEQEDRESPQTDIEDNLPKEEKPPAPAEKEKDTYSTPARYVNIGRRALGGTIDVDPATNRTAQWNIVQARTFYTIENNGLEQDWIGTVWLNMPYSNPTPWVNKLLEEIENRNVEAAVVLVNTDNSTGWWKKLACEAKWIGFPPERIPFWLGDPTNEKNDNRFCQTMFFIGDVRDEEIERLREDGHNWIVVR